MPLRHQINLAGSVKLMPEQFMPMLSQDIAQLKRDNDQVKHIASKMVETAVSASPCVS